ncbi:hypothetical protein M2G64_21595 [Vibrio vulnificus]|nr:hypothetical protein [Vibrio vulnificus]
MPCGSFIIACFTP